MTANVLLIVLGAWVVAGAVVALALARAASRPMPAFDPSAVHNWGLPSEAQPATAAERLLPQPARTYAH